jgi:ketosteroid isomerase-like protein
MKTLRICLLFICLAFYSCGVNYQKGSSEEWKQEIVETEKDFADLAGEKGIAEAFLSYAAEDAVLLRGDYLIVGKKDLRDYFLNHPSEVDDEHLSWKPDFVDVSASGDLGYSYGHFTYSYTDSLGSIVKNEGVFHTVWKRQSDGSWRFVWD